MNNFSESEKKLISHFGFISLINDVPVEVMYRIMIEKSFINNDQSEFACALRASYIAYSHRTVTRCTPEYDHIIEDILYTDQMRINDRGIILTEYWESRIPYIKKAIELEENKTYDELGCDNSVFKWNQLVHQEIFMFNKLNKQVELDELNWLCERRGFNSTQRQFIIDALDQVGLVDNFKNVCSQAST